MKFFQQRLLSSGLVAVALAFAGCADTASPAAQSEIASAVSCPTTQPFELFPEDTSPLDPSFDAFNAGARHGHTWCRLAELSWYGTPACPSAPVTLSDIIDELSRFDPLLRGYAIADGELLTAAEIAAIEPFTTVCSAGGPGFATAVHDNVSQSEPQGWVINTEIRCHNCHEFARVYVIWYPADKQVVIAPFVHGYDS